MDPGDSRVASLMIAVQYGTGSHEEMEKWFARAIQVDPDNLDAYKQKLNFLTPVWYGSAEEMVEFGVTACTCRTGGAAFRCCSSGQTGWRRTCRGMSRLITCDPMSGRIYRRCMKGTCLRFRRTAEAERIRHHCRPGQKWDVVREQLDLLGAVRIWRRSAGRRAWITTARRRPGERVLRATMPRRRGGTGADGARVR